MQAAWEFLQNALAKGITEAVIFIGKEASAALYSVLKTWQTVETAMMKGIVNIVSLSKTLWAEANKTWRNYLKGMAKIMLELIIIQKRMTDGWSKEKEVDVRKKMTEFIEQKYDNGPDDEKIKETEDFKNKLNEAIDDEFSKGYEELIEQEKDTQKRLEDARRKLREEMQSDHENKLREIVDNDKSTQTEIEKSRSDRIKQLEKEVEEARGEWVKALQDVRSADAEGGSKPKSISKLGTLTTGGLDLAKVTSAGAFSNFARFGMQGDAAERMATGIDAIAKNTKDLLEETREMSEGTV